jgi:hypothetical protein
MENKKQRQRHKDADEGKGTSSPRKQEHKELAHGVPTGDLALTHLSNLADSARREIIDGGSGPENSALAAQADLLVSRNKIEEVRRRIQTGYYGQPDIIGRIIDRLSDDLRP